jgi:hypothetical protein
MPADDRCGCELAPNLELDRKTVAAMVHIYCEAQHGSRRGHLCNRCWALQEYSAIRLAKCPFGTQKTTCRECPVHCYRPAERTAMKDVMRFAGPRMLWRHPFLALRHLWLERQGPPPWPPQKRKGRGSVDPRPHSEHSV